MCDSNMEVWSFDPRQHPKVFSCDDINSDNLSDQDQQELRIAYWAAYYGLTECVRWILVANRWSPFMKSYKKRSILAATICGKQIETAQMILSYQYKPIDSTIPKSTTKAAFFRVFGKDKDDNNVLHLCGLFGMREIHKMLRNSEFMAVFKRNKDQALKERKKTNANRV